eukprot:gnl/MRDRNA2_/MRDRNA2_47236_c0_seq1.p1 gnl/MRDRNA2_/MRDRNA2_47236_c0~~gnl/MRDRNA2_/MRDRNA2_47236_c0_seq1.p1  ORF type:complete len:1060 (-),score=204.29 gnl/MRDRNA2_/MRDRNA2_47236_c0_seq1:34-3213(-)
MGGKGRYRRDSRSCSRSYSPAPRERYSPAPREREERSDRRGKGKGKGKRGKNQDNWNCPRCGYYNFARNAACLECNTRAPPPGFSGSRGYEYEYEYYERCRYQDHQNMSYPSSYPGAQPSNQYPATWHSMPPQSDYALEKPDAYQAFIKTSVKQGTLGVEIVLSDKMCQDKHVPDLLSCLDAWFRRTFGNPALTGMTWTLGCLDLARNGLSDESMQLIIERLKLMDVRVRQLKLDANLMYTKGLAALTEYIWNCQDPIHEISLTDNQIECDPANPSDPVSALLRCVYNHPRYPVACPKTDPAAPDTVLPLTFMFKNNRMQRWQALLDLIKSNGQDKVKYCDSQAPVKTEGYHQYFLVIYLPDISEQKAGSGLPGAPTPALSIMDNQDAGKKVDLPNEEDQDPVTPRQRRREESGDSMPLVPLERRCPRSKIHNNPDTRYFVIKCNTARNLSLSMDNDCWATQAHNEERLNDAFRVAPHVVLLFSLNQSSAFQGYALMQSRVGKAKKDNIFTGWSRGFDIKWKCYKDLDFEEIAHIQNPMNEFKSVKISRDGQELPNGAGREICLRMDELQWAAEPHEFFPDENEPETGGPGRLDNRPEMVRRRRVRRAEAEPLLSDPYTEMPHQDAVRRRRHRGTEAQEEMPGDHAAEDPRGELRRRPRGGEGTPRPKFRARASTAQGDDEDVTPLRRRRRHTENLGETVAAPQWPGLERSQQIDREQGERRRKRSGDMLLTLEDGRERGRKRLESSPPAESLMMPNDTRGNAVEAQKRERVGLVKKKRRKVVNGEADSTQAGPMLPVGALQLQESDRKELEHGIATRISEVPDLPQEEGTFDMLAEYVVCLLLSGKGRQEVESEVVGFLEDNAPQFLDWLAGHLHEFLEARNLLGAKKRKATPELDVQPQLESGAETLAPIAKDASDADKQDVVNPQNPQPQAQPETSSPAPIVASEVESEAVKTGADGDAQVDDTTAKQVTGEQGEGTPMETAEKEDAPVSPVGSADACSAPASPMGSADACSPDFQGGEDLIKENGNPAKGEPEASKVELGVEEQAAEAVEKESNA